MSNKTDIEEDIKKITDMINYIRFDNKPIYTREEWFMAIEDMRIILSSVEKLQAKANKYDSLIENIKQIRDKLEVEDYYCSREALEDLNKILSKEGDSK